MDSLTTERRRELIRHVFPDLRYGGDPDIDRYFEYRRSGRLGEALDVYNGPLRRRYPDDAKRILLLKLYREHDPRWEEFQDRLILELADRIAAGMVKNIDILVAPMAGVPQGNAFKALGAVERLLAIIPVKDDDALPFLDRYATLAEILGYRWHDLDKARRLVGEYLAMTKAEADGETDFIARSAAVEERRRAKAATEAAARKGATPTESYDFIARSEALEERRRREAQGKSTFFDLSKIKFRPEDLGRILIPETLTRREDKVLAYCWKYWDLIRDPGFERLIFLYSQKFGTHHYQLFRAVKLGRSRGSTDDEILTAVSTMLSTSYSYSVSGDLYMQVNWRRLRANAEARQAAAAEAQALRETARLQKAAASPGAKTPNDERLEVLRAKVEAPKAKAAEPRLKARPQAGATSLSPRQASPKQAAKLSPRSLPKPAVEELRTRGGSVSDRIRKLSGKAYDVYRQLFLEGVRTDIHRILLTARPKGFRLFDDSANEAEDCIYAFMAKHYADPYMDWEASAERKKVEALGFALASLDPIIEAWYSRVA